MKNSLNHDNYVIQLLKAPFVKTYNIIKTQAGNELEEVRNKKTYVQKTMLTSKNKKIITQHNQTLLDPLSR